MIDTVALQRQIQAVLDEFCADVVARFAAISDDLATVPTYVGELLQGGKRLRGQFAFLAWAGCRDASRNDSFETDKTAMIRMCAALEMFHAAALVHDDLLDRSDTRRGSPAMHKRFESAHREQGWAGQPERFGQAGSVLVGDMMLAWANQIFVEALVGAHESTDTQRVLAEFFRMQTEVMAGQFLDVIEEHAGPTRAATEAIGRANRVMLYKTAKYSIEAPLLIGAAFAGTSNDNLLALSRFGIPLGLAFQLKDDILGVFGASEKTGKPVGDDLREGKRTVLIALTRESLTPSVARIFDELLADRELTSAQVEHLQQTIRDSGALQQTERMLEELAETSLEHLAAAELSDQARAAISSLAAFVIDRDR